MSTQKLKAKRPSGIKRAPRLAVTHVPRPRLAEAIKRMKRGQFVEFADVAAVRRAIETHKRRLRRA